MSPGGGMKRTSMRRVSAKERAFRVAWRRVRLEVLERDGYMCLGCGALGEGFRGRPRDVGPAALEVHHIARRRYRASKLAKDNLVSLCRRCHARCDAPYSQGRLVITALGRGRFTLRVIVKESKWAPDPV